ncbi:MAG: arsenate reductase [Pseudohongiellaceae bacterium]|jgi:arsenate reductase
MTTPLRLLFVCVENSCRSQLAEGFARAAGCEAYSAGSQPSGKVNPKAISSMAELSIDLAEHQSKSLSDLPAVPFDAAVTMGCGDSCPQVDAGVRVDWDIPDPKAMTEDGFREVRDRIRLEVAGLMAQLNET